MSNGIQRNGSSSPNKADESLLPPKVTSNHSYIEQSETRVYKRRWYILIMYCIIKFMQDAMWNTFGPIETTARAVYKWDGWVIDLIAAWGSVTFCITMLPFAWVVDVKGNKYYFMNFFCVNQDALRVNHSVTSILCAKSMEDVFIVVQQTNDNN